MVRLVNWLRILILCLSLSSFIIGLHLKDALEFPDPLTLIIVTEAFNVLFYSYFAATSNASTQMRAWRIFYRLVLASLSLYGPARALDGCEFGLMRDYSINLPGIRYNEKIHCDDGSEYTWRQDQTLLPAYHLFRARCILLLTVAVTMWVEMVLYWQSDEGSGVSPLPPPQNADIELGNATLDEPQKMVLPTDPTAAVR
ncbi:hypothetical protein BGZ70_002622 [Mortierella alpina]|uniref:Uncharacterized protein n=1 Tax=Mortierella alpina TaxID=64518 RepID=A0A9P6M5H7_MORAP|nr:hypothetical protein BGZ70_002622 [Mortierella alpina]